MKLSVAIPYKQRLGNLTIALEGLAHQTLDHAEFEVVVGAMEYSEEYVAACRKFAERINLVSVCSAREFSIPRARNLAMRQATGEVVVQMDADTLLPPDALENLYERHFAFGQRACVVGQVVGYDNNGRSVTEVAALSYLDYVDALERLGGSRGRPEDPRFQVPHVLPWAFAWTGLIALPLAAVRRHDLFFDETFHGWGVDDLEWGYRIAASGIPIILREDLYAIHLPHPRDADANRVTEAANYGRFLRKWPRPDVELAYAFGDVDANSLYQGFVKELRAVRGDRSLGLVRGAVAGRDTLLVGVPLDARGRPDRAELPVRFDADTDSEVLPLIGLALPYEDGSVRECRLLPALDGFSARYRDRIRAEATRAARSVLPAAP
ncbi:MULTISPECIES: glycosyltransferase family 2 protein [unclassified Micromonospora]|uniref:glycosyltransferase family 2 protein n=1 Tax=unclassified Micromonospora TaxID=2617518 RepID=UPI0009CFA2EB|nr:MULTISPECIES: glycosyltransferase [unclassified Micromonospora]MDI5936653.1 glycosyltransferase [Micromonospora sp. DH15]OON32468.1 hypothetical protein BSA16_05490 [Micromonospora sp. Rc5]